jgi:hypothetical protein
VGTSLHCMSDILHRPCDTSKQIYSPYGTQPSAIVLYDG